MESTNEEYLQLSAGKLGARSSLSGLFSAGSRSDIDKRDVLALRFIEADSVS